MSTNFIWPEVHKIWIIMQICHHRAPKNQKRCLIRTLAAVWEVYISQNTHNKSSLAVILKGQSAFYDQQFARQFFWAKMVSPTFQHDHQVNPKNRPSKDSLTDAVSFVLFFNLPIASCIKRQLRFSLTFQLFLVQKGSCAFP